MKQASLSDNLEYKETGPTIKILFESETSKEIRIVFKAGQVMKEHHTSYPITVELFEGELEFGVEGEKYHLKRGDLLSLAPSVPHDLRAISNCIVRLTLSKADLVQRVVGVARDSDN